MAYETKPNSGSAFKNEDKDPGNPQHEKWADYEGSAVIDGKSYFVNIWVNRPEGKKPYFSFKFKPKQQQRQQPTEGQPQRPPPKKPVPPRDPDLDPEPDRSWDV